MALQVAKRVRIVTQLLLPRVYSYTSIVVVPYVCRRGQGRAKGFTCNRVVILMKV